MRDRIKLTQRSVALLQPRAAEYKQFDSQLPGFHVRVQPSGVKTYAVFYRTRQGEQRQRALSLGRTVLLKAEQARDQALTVLVEARNGGDPSRARYQDRPVTTLADLFDEYLAKHARTRKKVSSVSGDELLWRKHLKPRLGSRSVTDLNHRDLDTVMAQMSDRKGAANRSIALLSKMMSLAVAWGYREDNPCKRVVRYPENQIERFLRFDEVARLRAALEADRDRSGATAITLLLLTGARRGEVLLATWDQFELGPEAPLWIIPRSVLKAATRTRQNLRRPLSDEAAILLREWRDMSPPGSQWLFPGVKDHTKPRPDLKKIWDRVTKEALLPSVRLHDLRHSFASTAINAGVSIYLVGRALGHANVRTTERYAHAMDSSIRHVANTVSKQLAPPA